MNGFRILLLILLLGWSPYQSGAQNKSLRFSATAGINRYFGLPSQYNFPTTEYTSGMAFSGELGFISGKKYLPGQYAFGVIVDYFSGTFLQYGTSLNGGNYLTGEASKLMLGLNLVPVIFDYEEVLFVKPGLEWTCLITPDIEGAIRSNEAQTYGEMIPLGNDFIKKADIGISITVEYVFDIKDQWYIAPRYKIYCSMYDVMNNMKSFRNTLGFSLGYYLSDRLYPW